MAMELAEQTLRQHICNAFRNFGPFVHMHCEVRELKFLGNGLYFAELLINQHFYVHCLAMDRVHEAKIFMDANSFMMLILNPMTEDVRNAIKDYHSIGHGI